MKNKKTKKRNTKIKKQKRYKGLKNNSLNHRVFSIIVYLLDRTLKVAVTEAKDILGVLGEYTTTSIMQKAHGTYYSNLEKSMPTAEKMKEASIKRALKELELHKYIKLTSDQNNQDVFKISLTQKGALEFLKYKVEKRKNKKWDGKWRVITFDILENQKQIRDLLRTRLKWLGFKELQKSVWIFPYDIEKETKNILEFCHIDVIGDLRFLTVEKISNDNDLKEEFNL